MKAETAVITINGRSRLKILLQPENDAERFFLADAWSKCVDYDVSYDRSEKKQ